MAPAKHFLPAISESFHLPTVHEWIDRRIKNEKDVTYWKGKIVSGKPLGMEDIDEVQDVGWNTAQDVNHTNR